LRANSSPVHTTTEKFEDPAIIGHFGFVFEESSKAERSHDYHNVKFRKAPFSKRFPSTLKRKAGVLKFLRFEGCFCKLPFQDRLVWTRFHISLAWRSVNGASNRFLDRILYFIYISVPFSETTAPKILIGVLIKLIKIEDLQYVLSADRKHYKNNSQQKQWSAKLIIGIYSNFFVVKHH